MNNARGKLVLGEKCLDSQLSNIHNELYWLKGPSNLVLVPFQPSEQLSHIKVGCSEDCNIRKVSMTSARQHSKRTELSQILKQHQLIFNRTSCTVRLGNLVDVGCFTMLILALPEPLANPSPFSLIWDSHIWNQFNM